MCHGNHRVPLPLPLPRRLAAEAPALDSEKTRELDRNGNICDKDDQTTSKKIQACFQSEVLKTSWSVPLSLCLLASASRLGQMPHADNVL